RGRRDADRARRNRAGWHRRRRDAALRRARRRPAGRPLRGPPRQGGSRRRPLDPLPLAKGGRSALMGTVEVICGPMFSGKTEELIRRLRRAAIAKRRVQVFKPRIDSRYDPDAVVSHSQQRIVSTVIDEAGEVLEKLAPDVEVIGIDGVPVLVPGIVPIVKDLANRGLRVVVAGLDQDYRGLPFDPIPLLLAEAEYITKELAICVVCGQPAGRSQRL